MMHATYRTDKDSVLGTTYQQGAPMTVTIDTAKPMPGAPRDPFMSCYKVLAAGDSANFLIPADSLFKGSPDAQRPPFLKSGSNLKLGVRVLRLESKAQMEARVAKELETLAGAGNFQMLNGGVYVGFTQKGAGAMPKAGDTLTVHYTGLLADTSVSKKPFDSSINPPQPGRPVQPFKLVHKAGMVIPGWDSAFAVIPEGSKARILIPYSLAYGAQGAPGAIPPFSNLIFDVELLKVTPPKAAPAKKK